MIFSLEVDLKYMKYLEKYFGKPLKFEVHPDPLCLLLHYLMVSDKNLEVNVNEVLFLSRHIDPLDGDNYICKIHKVIGDNGLNKNQLTKIEAMVDEQACIY